jgi:peptidoglycan/LPS O-acetylase OafA/YrhL
MVGRPTSRADLVLPLGDSLRGLAALFVFFFHLQEKGLFAAAPVLARKAMQSGWIGVDLFFVLSGFLITSAAFRGLEKPHYFKAFYLRRANRILPAYYVALCITIPAAFAIYDNAAQKLQLQHYTIDLFLLINNVRPALSREALPFGFNHLWSLAVEAQIYIVWPIAVRLFQGRQLIFICAGVVLFSVTLRILLTSLTGDWYFSYFSTPTRLDGFALGAIVACLSPHSPNTRYWTLGLLFGGSALVVATVANDRGLFPSGTLSSTVGILGTSMIFAGCIVALRFSRTRFEAVWPLNRLGAISYSFYIYHYPTIFLFRQIIMPKWGWTEEASINSDILWTIAIFCTAITLSAASYVLVERPSLKSR